MLLEAWRIKILTDAAETFKAFMHDLWIAKKFLIKPQTLQESTKA
jgi:hypothetical protein